MFRTFAVRGVIALALLLAVPAVAQVTTWDAARDFNGTENPNGQWMYGWKTTSTSLTPFPTYQPTLAAWPGRDAWQDLSRSSLLGLYHNSVGVSGDIPTNMLLLQPDPAGGELAVVEWTAPANMSLHVQGMFQSLDTVASQVTIVSGATTRFSATVNSTTSTASFGLFLNVVAGDKIDFVASGGAAGVNVVLSKLSLLGNASIQSIASTDTRLRVTSNALNQVGGTWTLSKQRFADGFDTSFLFNISQLAGGGADGFAFVIQNSSTNALGSSGGYLGYDGIPASLAVEFDTFLNLGWGEPNGNHISVHTLGANANSAIETASIARTTSIPNLKDGNWHLVRLHYAVQPQPQLSIYLDSVTTPVLQVAVDIVSKLQLADGTAWVGFTGGTGGFTEVHDIQNWHFLSYDLHAPVLTLPVITAVEGNTLGGATVDFTASALDAVDGTRPVTCDPASGTVFVVGNTTVSCSSTDLSGNSANGSFQVTVKDTTAPVLTVPVVVTASAVDGAGASVSFIATASDIVDGTVIPACSPASGSTFPLGTTVVTCTATDHASNSVSATFSVSVVDETPPVIASVGDLLLEATGALTAASWPAVTATDNVDGALAVLCTPASGSQFALGTSNVQCSATDAAGNTASRSFKVTVQDTTPPAMAALANLIVEATGPSGAVVTWPSPTASDLVDGSVAVICAPASGSTFSLGLHTVVCTATDAHNNSGSKSFIVQVQDTTAPVISCAKPDGQWHASDVSLACTADDGGSGMAKAAAAALLLTTSVPAGTETANALTNSQVFCDLAGNCATAGPIAGNEVDKRGPAITISAPTNRVYVLHQAVTASYSCADGGSGVATCTGSAPNGTQLDTSSFGVKQFTVSASDKVGNVSSASVSYSVGYNLCPLGAFGPKQSGSTIPVRIAACDYAGTNVSSPALEVVAVSVVGATESMRLQDAGNANAGMRFRYVGTSGGGGYIFNLQTKGFPAGTYQLLVRMGGEPTLHAVTFQIGSK